VELWEARYQSLQGESKREVEHPNWVEMRVGKRRVTTIENVKVGRNEGTKLRLKNLW
jgi:hypothetical protein